MAEWLRRGLQNLVRRFNSGCGLQNNFYFSVKKEKKILSFIFLAVFVSALFFIAAPAALAEETKTESKIISPFDVLQVKIPGLDALLKTDEAQVKCTGEGKDKVCEYPWVGIYIKAVYKFLVGISGMLAVIVMMAGGYYWLFAGGNAGRVTQAKEYIGGAIMGLALALGSYMILNLINPDILQLEPIRVGSIPEITIEQLKKEYEGQSCKNLTPGQIANALITVYCPPNSKGTKKGDLQSANPSVRKARQDFLCGIGINCDCNNTTLCSSEKRDNEIFVKGKKQFVKWTCFKDFDDTEINVCKYTASGITPQEGVTIAADLNCFPLGTKICIGGREYTVQDKGSAIKGLHFDVWKDDCGKANSHVADVRIGGCYGP